MNTYSVSVVPDGIPLSDLLKLLDKLAAEGRLIGIGYRIAVEAETPLEAAAQVRGDGLWIDDIEPVYPDGSRRTDDDLREALSMPTSAVLNGMVEAEPPVETP